MQKHFTLLAEYNAWMNQKLYATVAELSAEERSANRGAFFGSVHGTLNHLMVADRTWLQRFAQSFATPTALEWVAQLPRPQLWIKFSLLIFRRCALTEKRSMPRLKNGLARLAKRTWS